MKATVMILTYIVVLLNVFSRLTCNNAFTLDSGNSTDLPLPCSDFGEVLYANVSVERSDVMPLFQQVAHIQCFASYDLVGPPKVLCVDGYWEEGVRPQCLAMCNPPPYIKDGGVRIEGEKSEEGMYKKGAFATYSCGSDLQLKPGAGKYRICDDGVWNGSEAACVPVELVRCKTPKLLQNGYFVHENVENVGNYSVGQRIHYSCNSEFILLGSATQKCTEDGNWSPKLPPLCVQNTDDFNMACPIAPTAPHAATSIISGFQVDGILSGTQIEIRCLAKYHNIRSHCQPAKLKCVRGRWEGNLPICVYTKECPPPPDVRHGTPFDINSPRYEPGKLQRYFVNTQISYQCFPGYELQGNEILTCSSGCWTPAEPPLCKNMEQSYLEANGNGQVLISLATGAVVLLLLAIICLVMVCRRRKPLSRVVSIQPSAVPRPDLADHAALLHHPDRLALIAFADGMQVGQPVLPTYEEATRDRGPGLTATRVHRPHWPSLVARRSRNSPNPDSIHVTRQGSLASHSASTRSDPMGSTDTMAVSENSTTVTLDTASSYSGSQAASCRAHCGSLASFDTSSVLNTEGVPLLEESELEEIQGGDTVSLAMENRSMTDNGSFKLSIASDLA